MSITGEVTLDEIQADVSTYLKRVEHGETILVTKAGKPVVEMRPVSPNTQQRPFGLCAGEFIVLDDFDAPLPDNIIEDFEKA
jgi:prevent-host-death family protein